MNAAVCSRRFVFVSAILLIVSLVLIDTPGSAKAQADKPQVAPVILYDLGLNARMASDSTLAYEYALIKPSVTLQRDGRGDLGTEARIRNTGTTAIPGTQWGINWQDNAYSNIYAWDDIGPLLVDTERTAEGLSLTIHFRQPLQPGATYHYFFSVNVGDMATPTGDGWQIAFYVNGGVRADSLVESVTFPTGTTWTTISPPADVTTADTLIWKRGIQTGSWSFGVDVRYVLAPLTQVVPFLDLPVNYDGKSFDVVAQGYSTGKVNSWFDHAYPLYNPADPQITLWTGATISGSLKECTLGKSCYGGHNAIDYQHNGNLTNEPVFAAATGVVAEVCTDENVKPRCGRGYSYGRYVLINHRNGYATFYAHLASVDEKMIVGKDVSDRQQVGIMGGTGGHPVHLHFGVYYDAGTEPTWQESKAPVDPYGWSGSVSDPASTGDKGVYPKNTYLWRHPLMKTTTVDASGGTAATMANNVRVQVPAGYTTNALALTLMNTPPVAEPSAQLRSTGASFTLKTSGDQVTAAMEGANGQMAAGGLLTLTVNYSEAQVAHLDEPALAIWVWDAASNVWQALPSQVDPTQNLVMASIAGAGDFDLQAPLVCPADSGEVDDSYDSAVTGAVAYLAPYERSGVLDTEVDTDWVRIDLEGGKTYTFEVIPGAAGPDVEATLFDGSGVTAIFIQDNGMAGETEQIVYTAPVDGTYFIAVKGVGGQGNGCAASYQLRVTQEPVRLYLPALSKE